MNAALDWHWPAAAHDSQSVSTSRHSWTHTPHARGHSWCMKTALVSHSPAPAQSVQATCLSLQKPWV